MTEDMEDNPREYRVRGVCSTCGKEKYRYASECLGCHLTQEEDHE